MNSTLPIGDFSRATHLSVKMLRHYHEIGLLEPVDVDVDTGYRRYATEQIVTAQIIRRFRDLDMPLEDISLGPALNERGYYVGRVERNLYWVTDGDYHSHSWRPGMAWFCSTRRRPSATTCSGPWTRSLRPRA